MVRRDRISLIISAVALLTAVLAIGGATRWAQASVAVLVGGAVLMTLTSRRALHRSAPLMLLIGASALWTAIQLLPLPAGLVHQLDPTLDGLRTDGATLAGVGFRSTLSMDPPGTLRALTFLLTLSGIAVVALRLAVTERGRYWLMASVAGGAGIAAVVTGIHKLTGATSLYGLYDPVQGLPTIMGPLLNTNHLGCLMAVGAVASLGLALYTRQLALVRAGWAAVLVGCLVVAAASLSRGAMLAMFGGFAVTMATTFAQRMQSIERRSRRRREKFLATTVPVGIMIACGLTVGVYVGAGTVMEQLRGTSIEEIHEPTSKFAAWHSTFTLIEETPWVGIGRGAFESTFARVHPASAFATFSHPENEPLQAIVEWGIPVAVILGLLAVRMLLLAVRRWKDGPLAAGALGVVAAVAFQSNFDFGMELLGLALPVTVVLATLTYPALHEVAGRRLRLLQLGRAGHVVVLLFGAALLLSDMTQTVDEAHVALRDKPDVDAIHASIAAHPLDYFGYAALTELMVAAKDPQAARVLNHALRLHPTQAGLHWIAARLLVRSGRISQAESEYATTLRYSPNQRPVLLELIRVLPPEQAVLAIPIDLQVDKTVVILQAAKRADVALLWLDRVLTYAPSLRSSEFAYSLAMDQKHLETAERAARVRCKIVPSTQCQLALARVLAGQGKSKDVVDTLADVPTWHGHSDEQIAGWLLLCDGHIALGHVADSLDCLRRLEVSGLVRLGDAEIQRRRDSIKAASGMPVVPGRP